MFGTTPNTYLGTGASMLISLAKASRSPASSADVYHAVFERLLPPTPPLPLRGAEVFQIAPERFDPFAPGLREVRAFPDLAALPGDRPYPVRTPASAPWLPPGAEDGMLRVYVSPVEWQGLNDATVEAGVSVDGVRTEHWVWRLARTGTSWVVLCRELVWSG